MFEGFDERSFAVGDVEIAARVGGSGPPLLLLHGAPQTHVMWHAMAPRLAETHTVVATDLRGYGASSKPRGGGDHSTYSFRSMAQDQVDVMGSLGHDRFTLVGHDRGGRVAHRLTLDHPQAVARLAVLDIVPTQYVYEHADRALATAYWHWFFLIQPEPLPEMLLEPRAGAVLRGLLGAVGDSSFYAEEALAAYERAFDAATIHALCEDYRAAASIDLEHDAEDRGRRIECPMHVLWGTRGVVGQLYEPLEVWEDYAASLSGGGIDAGHFLAEERPDEVYAALAEFLRA